MFDKLKSRFGGHSDFEANTYVRITQEGADAVEKDQIASIKQFSILATLHEHSPESLSSLSKKSQVSINDTKDELVKLKKARLVQLVED